MKVREPDVQKRDAAYVAGMMQHAGWRVLEAYMTERITSLEARILRGDLTHDDYLARTGELRGVKSVVTEMEQHAHRHAQEARKSA